MVDINIVVKKFSDHHTHRVMILGASSAQLPIIFKALEMGCYVITVDNLPSNIGHTFSHQQVNCSTVNQQAVCKLAKDLNIDGIVTFASDVATTTVAFVAETLQLKGCKPSIAKVTSNKANFRLFQQQNSLNHPDFFICQSIEALEQKLEQLKAPLIFKPVDTSGSRGITKLDDMTRAKCSQAFINAQRFSISGKISVEEFIEGIDVSGDGFFVGGQLCAIVSQKYKQGFVPIGHSCPSNLSDKDQQRIFLEVSNLCQTLGYTDGPIDFDVKISDDRVVVIEMSPRLGGNGIPELIKRCTGVDLAEMTLRYALNKTCLLPKKISFDNPCGSWIFGSDCAGKIEHIASVEDIKNKVDTLIECRFNYQINDNVPTFEHSGNSLGYALFDYSAETNYENTVMQIQAAMQLRITSDT